jgi:hypothetical protein
LHFRSPSGTVRSCSHIDDSAKQSPAGVRNAAVAVAEMPRLSALRSAGGSQLELPQEARSGYTGVHAMPRSKHAGAVIIVQSFDGTKYGHGVGHN